MIMEVDKIKKYINNKEYDLAIQEVRKLIIDKTVELIRCKNNYFEYTVFADLYNASKVYLDKKITLILGRVYYLEELDQDEETLDMILNLYKNLIEI